jgi:hypothetical protein
VKAQYGASMKRAAQALVLGSFAALLALGRLGFWAIAFGLGLVMETIRPGRLYCMWLCPIRAAHGLAGHGSAVKGKKGAQLLGTKTAAALGRVFIAIFLALFGISLALGLRGWLFPTAVAIGLILSFALSLPTQCSSFCPFGAAFTAVRRISGKVSALLGRTSPTQPSE